jgi:hypothetical protein
MRILGILAVSVALSGLATLAPAAHAPAGHATPSAFIDIGAILSGDENEPDENEADEGNRAQQPPAHHRTSISVTGVLLSAAFGAIAALFVASRLRRLRARLRRWGAGRAAIHSVDPSDATSDRR